MPPKQKAPKYRAIKFDGDDQYSWAVFDFYRIQGYKSPIFSSITDRLGIKPFVSGCTQTEARNYIKQFVKRDKEKNG